MKPTGIGTSSKAQQANLCSEKERKYDFCWEEAVAWLRAQPDKSKLVRECYFDDPLQTAAERFVGSQEWLEVVKQLPAPSGLALDLGPGRGITSYALAREGWQVVALEPDASDLVGAGAIAGLAHDSKLPLTVVRGYGEQAPFSDRSFQLVLGRQVLHHARDLSRLCREVSRLLAPGGLFLCTREHVISRACDLGPFLETHPLHHLYGGENAFLLRDYLNAIRGAGLKVRRAWAPLESPINYYPLSEDTRRQRCLSFLPLKTLQAIGELITRPNGSMRQVILAWLARLFAGRDNTPGRLYSFLAVRPI